MYRNLDGIMHAVYLHTFYDQSVRVLILAFFVIDNVFEKNYTILNYLSLLCTCFIVVRYAEYINHSINLRAFRSIQKRDPQSTNIFSRIPIIINELLSLLLKLRRKQLGLKITQLTNIKFTSSTSNSLKRVYPNPLLCFLAYPHTMQFY